MSRAKKVVLAYSGGVDTSVCIPYLKNEWGVEEVITLAADLGQGDELEPIRKKALASGASESLVIDATEEFVKDYAFPAIQANALYENRYPCWTAPPPFTVPMRSPTVVQVRETIRCGSMCRSARSTPRLKS